VRALMAGYGLLVAIGAVLLAGVAPLFVQRVFAAAAIDETDIVPFFTAWVVTLLAQAGVTFICALVLAYSTGEVFVPRREVRLRGVRAVVWKSLHRLGNATSITLVLAVAGSAIGLTLFGEALETGADSPAELAGIQLGTLLTVLTIALFYESVRVVVDLLSGLPALWRWGSALVYPWLSLLLAMALVPFDQTVLGLMRQWGQPDVDEATVSTQADPLIGLVLFVVLWSVHLVESGQAGRVIRSLRASR
jgi:hypothetical protein